MPANSNTIEPPSRGASEEEQAIFLQSLGLRGTQTDDAKRPFRFHGKVLDERDLPVPGVKISLDWNEPPPAQPEQANAVSDENGQFAVDVVTGRYLRVSLDSEDYYVSRSNQFVFYFSPEVSQSRANEPFLFRLRKKGPGANLVTSNFGMKNYVSVKAPKNGLPLRLDFFTGKTGEEGQLTVSNLKPLDGRERSDWSFSLSVPGGGLIEHHDEFPFEAPEGGYQSVLEFRYDGESTNWVSGFKKDFYLMFGQPKRYGRIRVETDTFTGAHIEYAINPDGSRYLESR